MSIHAVDARVKTATLTGIVSQDTCVWPSNDFGTWASFDLGGTTLVVVTGDGLTVTYYRDVATQDGADVEGRTQTGDPGTTSWEGNFSNGDTVLFSRRTTGPDETDDYMEFRFDIAQKGVGFQLARNSVGSNWTGEAKFYDALDVLLLTVTRTDGVAGDASAITEVGPIAGSVPGTFGANAELAGVLTPLGTDGVKPGAFSIFSADFGFAAVDNGVGGIVAVLGALGSGGTHTINYVTGAFSTSSAANPLEPIATQHSYLTKLIAENSAIFMGAAYDAVDAANIKKVRVNVFNDPGGGEETFGINFMTFGPFDPLVAATPFLNLPLPSVRRLLPRTPAPQGRPLTLAEEVVAAPIVNAMFPSLRRPKPLPWVPLGSPLALLTIEAEERRRRRRGWPPENPFTQMALEQRAHPTPTEPPHGSRRVRRARDDEPDG